MLAALCLALIASAIALPHNTTDRISKRDGPKIHIGYRSVSSVSAQQYINDQNQIIWSAAGATGNDQGIQLGQGIYISFNMADFINEYVCDIHADVDAWAQVQKAWVPQFYDFDDCTEELWWQRAKDARDEYLEILGGDDYRLDNTVLISKVDQGLWEIEQLLIPAELASANNPLGLEVECTNIKDPELLTALGRMYGPVDWRSTFGNVRGRIPSPPPPAPFPPNWEFDKLLGNYASISGYT